MNQLARAARNLLVPANTANLIRASVSENTQRAYRRGLINLERWLSTSVGGSSLNDAIISENITELHHQGESPITIAQVAAARW